MDRRQFVAGATLALAACGNRGTAGEPEDRPPVEPPLEPGVVRIASVKTAVDGNLLPALVERFQRDSRYRVRVTTGERVYDLARTGDADLVISHYGHRDAEAFVLDGLGEWPRTIFSNQMALVGPPNDPANVRGLDDVGEAFRRIAETHSQFMSNEIDGVRYLVEILWHAAGEPERTSSWWLDEHASKNGAVIRASRVGAYTFWGLTPFLRLASTESLALEPLVLADPLLQRILVSIVVKPNSTCRVNRDGAIAFQSFLLSPKTQAAIRSIHYPGKTVVGWVPAGRHNRTGALPQG
jgi:tungstate transport system substrate-binding protein